MGAEQKSILGKKSLLIYPVCELWLIRSWNFEKQQTINIDDKYAYITYFCTFLIKIELENLELPEISRIFLKRESQGDKKRWWKERELILSLPNVIIEIG